MAHLAPSIPRHCEEERKVSAATSRLLRPLRSLTTTENNMSLRDLPFLEISTTYNAMNCTRIIRKEFRRLEAGIFAGKYIVVPSFVDVHVHFREPGFFYKESILTGSQAAARAGYSHVMPMPNLNPVPDSKEHLKEELDIIGRDAVINVIPYGSITVGEKGRELADLEGMAPDVCAFSDDGVGLNDPELMKEAMARKGSG